MYARRYAEQQEVLVVAFTYTSADPGAVVVVDFDARFATAAMERPWGFNDVTSATDRQRNLFRLYCCVVVVIAQATLYNWLLVVFY